MQLWIIEMWRGVAAMLVVWMHWSEPLGLQGGAGWFAFTGVDIFFVISGFIFAPHILGKQEIKWWSFAIKRIFRIYPAYLTALSIYIIIVWQSGKPILYLPEHILMIHLQTREMAFYYNPPFWSLPSEVAFYALIPVVAWVIRCERPWIWPGLFAGAVLLRLGLLSPADSTTQNMAYLLLHHLPGLLIEFLLGVWAWQRTFEKKTQCIGTRSQHTNLWWVAIGTGVCSAATWIYGTLQGLPGQASWFNGQLGLWVAVGFACILIGMVNWRPRSRCATQTGVWGGRLSYGIYLLHTAWLMPVLLLRSFFQTKLEPLGITGSVAPIAAASLGLMGLLVSALALHLLVEEPMRRWVRSF